MPEIQEKNSRKDFIRNSLILAVSGTAVLEVFNSCKDKEEDEKEVSPPEDLMQEHGLLNRILLIYDCCRTSLMNKNKFPADALQSSASIIRQFVEDYHEKQEEDYLFTRFRKANQLTDLVQILLQQHNAGRKITDQLLEISKTQGGFEADSQKIILLLSDFNTMYRPHEAREDTVLFPAFRKLVSQHEYDSLGEEFEKNEQKHFGKDGFESMVSRVEGIEKTLGIYDLAQFTPVVV